MGNGKPEKMEWFGNYIRALSHEQSLTLPFQKETNSPMTGILPLHIEEMSNGPYPILALKILKSCDTRLIHLTKSIYFSMISSQAVYLRVHMFFVNSFHVRAYCFRGKLRTEMNCFHSKAQPQPTDLFDEIWWT